MEQVAVLNEEAIEAWNGPLFDRFLAFRPIVTSGLGNHGEALLAWHPPQAGDHVLDIGCGFGDTTQRLAGIVGQRAPSPGSTRRNGSSSWHGPRPAMRGSPTSTSAWATCR